MIAEPNGNRSMPRAFDSTPNELDSRPTNHSTGRSSHVGRAFTMPLDFSQSSSSPDRSRPARSRRSRAISATDLRSIWRDLRLGEVGAVGHRDEEGDGDLVVLAVAAEAEVAVQRCGSAASASATALPTRWVTVTFSPVVSRRWSR